MLSILPSEQNAEQRDSKQVFNQWFDKESSCFQCIFNDCTLTGSHGEMINNMPSFIDYLKNNGFEDKQLNKKEQEAGYLNIIAKNKRFMQTLCINNTKATELETLFAIANRFFEYCFSPATWPLFYKILKTPIDYPIARLIYSTMWYNLSGDGWRNWHSATLKTLQKKCAQGDYVTYIAGGTDIYQLLDYGIYNIKIIDPMLPTQPKYYSQGWDWLIKGAIGDELTISTKHKKLLLRRNSYQETGTLSVTDWQIFDQKTGIKIGTVTYDRRFCQQTDFLSKPGQHLLMSFNELYFLTTIDDDNWGINPQKLPKDFILHIKQLRRTIDKKMLCNMRTADASKFCFIRLGSSIN